MGHVLLEEHTPTGIGNHAVIITEPHEETELKLKALLEDIGYTGFSNFDMKYDEKDGKYKDLVKESEVIIERHEKEILE